VDVLITVLALVLAVAILFEVAGRIGVPYPALLVVGGLVLAFVPAMPRLALEPDLVLLVFLPPLLFRAAFETPLRDLKADIGPIARLSIGLVAFTMVVVAFVAQATIPGLGWAAAFTLGAIVSPTDPLAATTVFQRLHVPRRIVTVLEGEGLLNDATALVAYRAAAAAAVGGSFVLADTAVGFVAAIVGGIIIGGVVGAAFGEVLRRLENPPVEVAVSLVIPFAAYLPADLLGLSAVLAAVVAGLVVGRRSAVIYSPASRTLGHSTWKMITFLLNGFAFILIGLELPSILSGLATRAPATLVALVVVVSGTVIAARFVWVYAVSLLPGSLPRSIAERDPALASKTPLVASWAGLRGAVSLAAALALPAAFPERDLILLLTFGVIVVTLLGQGLTLPLILGRLNLESVTLARDEETLARAVASAAGLTEIERIRPQWADHQPLLDRLESGLRDREAHLATDDPDETDERRRERREHEEIQRSVIAAQRSAVIELRDRGEINDQVLRTIEREQDLEELRMEA
jgi:Na+/H+ antiporter